MKIKNAAILGGVVAAVWYLSKSDHPAVAAVTAVVKPAIKKAPPVAVPKPVVLQSQDEFEGHYAGSPPIYYGNPYGYNPYGYETASQCAAQGGLYDSFSGTCSSAGSGVQQTLAPALYNQPYYNQYGQYVVQQSFQIPNVIGLSLNVAVKVLNNAGLRVWIVQNESAYRGAPPGVDPGRVDLVISGGAVQSARVG